jgi:hypothetical protein
MLVLKLLRWALAWLFALTLDELILWLLPMVAAAVNGLLLALIEDLQWHTIILVSVVSAVISFGLLRLVLEGVKWLGRRKPFTVRPIPGDTSGTYLLPKGAPGPTEPQTVHARLEVKTARFLRNCSVTVVGMWGVERQRLMKLAQDPQVLCWMNDNTTKQDLTPAASHEG